MTNHIHLLMKEGAEDLGTVFKRVGATYVYWYNWKYSKRGHLFQDRYKSEAVETDAYFLTVLRYIHQNPIKAGIVKRVDAYEWSSYREYKKKQRLCDTVYPLKLFSSNKEKALTLFKAFHCEDNFDRCMDYDDHARLNDMEATDIITSVAGVKRPTEIQGFEKERRNKVVKKLKDEGLSIRQLERLTGISCR